MLIHRVEQQNSEVPRAQSVQQHHLDSIFMVSSWTTSCSPSVVLRRLHAALCRPVDCQCVQHGSDVWLHDLTLMDSLTHFSVPAAGGQHGDFCEEGAEEDAEGCESRLPRMLRESEGG